MKQDTDSYIELQTRLLVYSLLNSSVWCVWCVWWRIRYVDHVPNEEVLERVSQKRLLLGKLVTETTVLRSYRTSSIAAERHCVGLDAWDSSARWAERHCVGLDG